MSWEPHYLVLITEMHSVLECAVSARVDTRKSFHGDGVAGKLCNYSRKKSPCLCVAHRDFRNPLQ